MQTAIIAIHGGGIESGTDEIAKQIAGENFLLYINRKRPHIVSKLFKDKKLDKILSISDRVISIHGEKSTEEPFVILGGLDFELKLKIQTNLHEAGFSIKEADKKYAGLNPRNVCNRGKRGKGVQIEISRKLREDLLNNPSLMSFFCNSIVSTF